MNLILIDPEEIKAGGKVVLKGRRRKHVTDVLGAVVGDRLRVGVVNGPRGRGEVVEVSERTLVLRLELDRHTLPLPEVDLILALPRPLVLKRLLPQAAIMGVGRLFLINAWKVEKGFFGASLLAPSNYGPLLRYGLEQAMDTRVPEVHVIKRFRVFEEEHLPGLLADCTVGLLAHPEAREGLVQAVKRPLEGRVVLAIGPEGGWVDYEVEALEARGLVPFSMGERILRVDTAVTALLAQLDLLRQVGP